jgi:hypothetical protein
MNKRKVKEVPFNIVKRSKIDILIPREIMACIIHFAIIRGLKYQDLVLALSLKRVSKYWNDCVKYWFSNTDIVFDLSYSRIDDLGIRTFSEVKYICLTECRRITNAGLASFTRLHTIYIGGSAIDDTSLSYLGNVNKVVIDQSDYLYVSRITDTGISYLKNVYIIKCINCCCITDYGITELRGTRKLKLKYCPKITVEGLRHLKLDKLEIEQCGHIIGGLNKLSHIKAIKIIDPITVLDNYNGVLAMKSLLLPNVHLSNPDFLKFQIEIYEVLYSETMLLKSSSDAQEGISVHLIASRLSVRVHEVLDAIQHLMKEGFVYSTIDEHHFSPTDC